MYVFYDPTAHIIYIEYKNLRVNPSYSGGRTRPLSSVDSSFKWVEL